MDQICTCQFYSECHKVYIIKDSMIIFVISKKLILTAFAGGLWNILSWRNALMKIKAKICIHM